MKLQHVCELLLVSRGVNIQVCRGLLFCRLQCSVPQVEEEQLGRVADLVTEVWHQLAVPCTVHCCTGVPGHRHAGQVRSRHDARAGPRRGGGHHGRRHQLRVQAASEAAGGGLGTVLPNC